jgi:hypothetical protein
MGLRPIHSKAGDGRTSGLVKRNGLKENRPKIAADPGMLSNPADKLYPAGKNSIPGREI